MRGSMFLIDRGLAALEIKQLLETRENTKYSNSALARELKLIGWSLDDRTLGLAIYSAVNLLPHIPKALWAGLGQDSVQKLRKTCGRLQRVLDELARTQGGSGNLKMEFDVLWQTVFSDEG